MVHALEEIHRLLRPNGILIDIHPFPQAPEVKVIQGDEVIFAEPKRDIQDEDEDVKQADRALAEVVERGLFDVEHSEEFDFFSYASSVPELRDFWEKYNAYDDTLKAEARLAQEEDVYTRAEQIRRELGDAEAAIHEKTKIARLKPKLV